MEEKYRKLQTLLASHKRKTRRAGDTGMSSVTQLYSQYKDEDNIKESAEELAKQKLEEEAKYTQLHLYYEEQIKKVEAELLAKETALRDQSRLKTHNQRLQKLNTFYKKKKLRDEIQRKKDEEKIKEYQELLAGKIRPLSNDKDMHRRLQANVIAEEKSRMSDDSKTHEFYHSSSDEDERKRKSKSPTKTPDQHRTIESKGKQNRDLKEAEDASNEILQKVQQNKSKERPIANQRQKGDNSSENITVKQETTPQRKDPQPSKQEKFELTIKDGNITTAPIGNNKIPELKKVILKEEFILL